MSQSDNTPTPIASATKSLSPRDEADWVIAAARFQINQILEQPRLAEQGGVRFTIEAICHLVDNGRWTREALKKRLPRFLPQYKPAYLRELLDQLIGTQPDSHPIFESKDSVLARQPFGSA